MNITTRITRRLNLNSKVIGLMIVLFIAVITGIAIADKKWIYLGLVFIPFILYLCVEKPFIFPFGFYLLLIPFDAVLSLSGSSQGATLTKFLGVLTILVFSIKGVIENKLKKPDSASIWWVLFIIYGVSSLWWAINPGAVISTTLIGLIVLYLVVSSFKIQQNEFDTLKWCLLVGSFLAAVFTIYNYDSLQTNRAVLEVGSRNAGDMNRYAFAFLIPVSICIEKVLKQNNKLIKVLFGGVLGVLIFGIIISGSRGSMLGIAAIFIVYILSMKQKITFITVLIVIGIALSSFLPSFFYERWGNVIEGGGAGRLSIWYVGLMCLKEHWLIGAGLGNFHNAYSEFALYSPKHFMGYYRAPHNIYLGNFVELGIIGFSLFIMAIIKHYQSIRSRFSSDNSNQVMLRAAFWGILVSCFFLDTVYIKSFWLLWMLIMMNKNIFEGERIT